MPECSWTNDGLTACEGKRPGGGSLGEGGDQNLPAGLSDKLKETLVRCQEEIAAVTLMGDKNHNE
jgi:hypothetical protein